MQWTEFTLRKPLLHAARNVESSQQKLLQSILQHNARTDFGKRFDFSNTKTMDDYRARVPVQTHASLAEYISRQINGEKTLTADVPQFYARTSGTTGGYKDIPLTKKGLQQVKHAQKQLALSLWRDTDFLKGSILGFASAAEEGHFKNGCGYGSVSGSTYRSVSSIVASKFLVPPAIFTFKDVQAKYQIYALATLASDSLTGIVAANPSSILKLVRIIEDNTERLLHCLFGGESDWLLPEARALMPQLRKKMSAERALKLGSSFSEHGKLHPQDVFPVLSAIATWTGGSCGIALRQLKAYLPSVRVVEYGYGASEFMGSVNVDAINNQCLPQLHHHVYEFVKREEWGESRSEDSVFYGAHELIAGQEYYVIVTTQSGLYRYDINDIICAGEAINNCATFSFLQKGRGVTNITGEKLSEHQLIAAMGEVIASLEISVGGYIGLANEEESRYDIYLEFNQPSLIERIATDIDAKLRSLNIEYDDKRSSNRLQPATVTYLAANACDVVKEWCVAEGVREAQYKPTVLAYARDWQQRIASLLLEPSL